MKKVKFLLVLFSFILFPHLVNAITCTGSNNLQAEILIDKEKIKLDEKAFITINTNNEYIVKYENLNKDIISISDEGIITPLKDGKALVSVTIDFIVDNIPVSSCPSTLNIEVLSNDSKLKMLSLEEADISPSFSADKYDYTAEVPYSYDKVNIMALASNSKSKINGAGRRYLTVGNNSCKIEVTATDGTSTIYKLNVIRKAANNDNSLKNLEVTGYKLNPEFSADITKYQVEVGNTSNIEINAIPNDKNASVSGNKDYMLATGSNVIIITVKAENGGEKKYEIEAIRSTGIKKLTKLEITDYKLDEKFKSDNYLYHLTIPSNINELQINATAEDNSKIVIEGNENLKEGLNEVFIKIGSASEESTYKIIVNKLDTKEEKIIKRNNILFNVLLIMFIISIIIMATSIIIFIKRNTSSINKAKKKTIR